SAPLSGEPDQYSATVVRMIEAGERREETMRVVVAGDKRREDWTEGGEPLALINRPDLGKNYLLDLRRKLYVEADLNQMPPEKNANATKPATNSDNGDSSANPMVSGSIEDNFEEVPTSIETRTLPAETIAGERCAVTERRARFADGHREVLKICR